MTINPTRFGIIINHPENRENPVKNSANIPVNVEVETIKTIVIVYHNKPNIVE